MANNREQYICKTEGFSTRGFPKYNEDGNKMVRVNHGDIVSSDSKGYLWKDGICICHKESIVGRYHFKIFQKNKKGFLERTVP